MGGIASIVSAVAGIASAGGGLLGGGPSKPSAPAQAAAPAVDAGGQEADIKRRAIRRNTTSANSLLGSAETQTQKTLLGQ